MNICQYNVQLDICNGWISEKCSPFFNFLSKLRNPSLAKEEFPLKHNRKQRQRRTNIKMIGRHHQKVKLYFQIKTVIAANHN